MVRSVILGLILSVIFCVSVQAETFSQLASDMVGKPISVKCEKLGDEYGEVSQYAAKYGDKLQFHDQISLSSDTCVWLRGLMRHHIFDAGQQANALSTLLHESYHIRLDSSNESLVECTAMKNLWTWLEKFHYSKSMTAHLYSEAWQFHWALPDRYIRTGYGCDKLGLSGDISPVSPIHRPEKKEA